MVIKSFAWVYFENEELNEVNGITSNIFFLIHDYYYYYYYYSLYFYAQVYYLFDRGLVTLYMNKKESIISLDGNVIFL